MKTIWVLLNPKNPLPPNELHNHDAFLLMVLIIWWYYTLFINWGNKERQNSCVKIHQNRYIKCLKISNHQDSCSQQLIRWNVCSLIDLHVTHRQPKWYFQPVILSKDIYKKSQQPYSYFLLSELTIKWSHTDWSVF